MSVVDIPVSALDNESDLMDWLATELVTNHRFVEERRTGSVAGNDLIVFLSRPGSETYLGATHIPNLLLLLEKGDNTEGASNKSFSFNIAFDTFDNIVQTVAPAAITVDFDTTGNGSIQVLSGAFTNWTTAGYTNGDWVYITNAATAGNNGYFAISTISTTTLTNDTINLVPTGSGGPQDLAASDLSDAITVEGQLTNSGLATMTGFSVSARSDTVKWNWGVDKMGSTAPYLRARLITNPTSNSATPSEPLSFIVVVEVDTDIYRKFGFGEVVKLVDYTGGFWASGDLWNEATDVDGQTVTPMFCQGVVGSITYSENLNSNAAPFAVYSADWIATGTSDENGRGWFFSGSYGSSSFDAPTQYPMATFHYLGSAAELIGYSPSAFSGQSERWPIVCFAGFGNKLAASGYTLAPMCIVPDVFLADITNVDAYSVIQDDYGEKFMVVPMYTKAGSGVGSSEKWGYLIRNPDLTVT